MTSYLARPRAHFAGKWLVNSATGNNVVSVDQPYTFDPITVTFDPHGHTTAQLSDWFHRLNRNGTVNAGWNYYGDHSVFMENVTITGVELAEGDLITDPHADTCIGAQIQLLGDLYRGIRKGAVMVDLDPNDGFSTRLFASYFGLTQGDTTLCEATARIQTVARWINSWRNLKVGGDRGASAVWHLAFPPDSLAWRDTAGSPFLQALAGHGISVRLCVYLFQHLPWREIAQRFQEGDFSPTPGHLLLVGTLGVWDGAEPLTMPLARLLVPNPALPLTIPRAINSRRANSRFFLGPALAQLDTRRKIITLDLVNTFPEVGDFVTLDPEAHPIGAPEKLDLGTLALQVIDPDSGVLRCVAALPFANRPGQPAYNRAAWTRTAGIVECLYDPDLEDALVNGDLALMQGAAPLLRETPWLVIDDQRSVLLDLDEQPTARVPLRALLRGEQVPVTLTTQQTLNRATEVQRQSIDDPGEAVARVPLTVRDTLAIRATAPGAGTIWLHTPDDPEWQVADSEADSWLLRHMIMPRINIRVLPDDRRLDSAPLTWDTLYEHVFRLYSLLFPAMNAYVNFEDETATYAAADRIAGVIDPALLDSTLYMPVTRDLSASKRRLLRRWAARQRGP